MKRGVRPAESACRQADSVHLASRLSRSAPRRRLASQVSSLSTAGWPWSSTCCWGSRSRPICRAVWTRSGLAGLLRFRRRPRPGHRPS